MPPKVLIGIPTLNGPERLERALASIKEHTDLTDVTVVVSDDHSSPDNLLKNKHVVHKYGVPLLMADHRLGISQQWNRLVRHVPDAELVVLLNDDVEVVADWLDVLVFSLERNPCIGMVGLRSENGTKDQNPPRHRIDFNEGRLIYGDGTLLASVGACFAFRRIDWESVGGFDERYFCYYEELDFGVMLATKLARVNCIAEYPILYHMVGATMGNLKAHRILADSLSAFTEKWGRSLDSLRGELGQRNVKLIHWHSQWKHWRSP